MAKAKDDYKDLPAAIDFGRVPGGRHFGSSLLSLRRGAAEIAMPLKRLVHRREPGEN